MAPQRRLIERIQSDLALISARAASSRAPEPSVTREQLAHRLDNLSSCRADIEKLMAGRPAMGPAEDCFRAISVLEDRIKAALHTL